jgi:hypothetical protein
VSKFVHTLLCLLPLFAFANNPSDALKAREEAMRALQGFNPASVLKGYTNSPTETALQPQEGSNQLTSQGLSALNNNGAANEVYQQAHSREKVASNSDSSEMHHAERILENAEKIDSVSVGCGMGECDASSSESSTDQGEGIARLGALAGVAEQVAEQQVRSGAPSIFTGSAYECKKYPLGFRDCCTGSGWGDWIKHCPSSMQALQLAKAENRAVYLGSYKRHKLGAQHYAYCIFPSKLGGIIQVQGRGGQLGISFGMAKYPNCRGITPEELERINFSTLDLSLIQQELIAKMALPNSGVVSGANQAHVELLKEQGRSHD